MPLPENVIALLRDRTAPEYSESRQRLAKEVLRIVGEMTMRGMGNSSAAILAADEAAGREVAFRVETTWTSPCRSPASHVARAGDPSR
jgi:hypothetical protein